MNLLVGIEQEFQNTLRMALAQLYDDTPEATVFETIDLRTVEWLPCSRRAKRFVPVYLIPVNHQI